MSRGTVAAVLLLTAAAARPERLPIRIYTTADGLASTNLNCIVRDSLGFLWLCTADGISRFDGYVFANYTFSGSAAPQPGVGRAAIDFLETRNGDRWVAAPHALCRFNTSAPTGNPLSQCYQPPSLSAERYLTRLAEDRDGSIWVQYSGGLFRFFRNARRFEEVHLGRTLGWTNLMQDTDGSLWLGAEGALAHRLPDGHVDWFGEAEGMPVNADHYFRVSGMLRDRDGRLWIATWQGLCLMAPHPEPGKRAVRHVYTTHDGLPSSTVFDVFESHNGKLWVSGEAGLGEWVPPNGATAGRFRSYTARKGFNLYGTDGPGLDNLAEDASGDLWMSGPMRLAKRGFVSYGTPDGLNSNEIKAVFEDRDGRLIAISRDSRPRHFNVFDGERFHPVLPRLPAWIHEFTWGQGQIHFQDHTGAWWVATAGGVCRYPRVRVEDLAHTLPERIYTTRDGLPGLDIFRLFEDSRGDVWISVVGCAEVYRWSRAADRIEVFRQGEHHRELDTPIAFAEDHAGNVWMSFYYRDLARYRNGRFEVFRSAEGLPGRPGTLFVDHTGRLWIASGGEGLVRVDDPSAEKPQFRSFGLEAGLSSNEISCIVEDQWGRIYAGSPHGIDQFNPATGRIWHYDESAGLLSPGHLAAAYRDRQGNLWFGGETLAKFVPEPDDPTPPPPPIRITRVSTRGGPYAISELGQSSVKGIRLRSGQNAIRIEFASVNFGISGNIRFQYKLEGSQQDWSAPSESRTVDYASLSSGSYRFQVRAVNAEGLTSKTPASVVFVILPPLWERWWFVGLIAVAVSMAILTTHRYRVRQLLELERVRTRIATDLHDDIGSSLAQIAILSEVAMRNGTTHGDNGADPLEHIADLSRSLVDSMSDIVWSINPQRDRLSALEYRMRRFASDVLAPRDIDFDLFVPPGVEDIPLRAEVRRHVYLIFKECIHNAVRHAACRRIEMTLERTSRELLLRLSDDGKGFVPDANGHGHGHGLESMRHRACEAGGELQIASEPGRGTKITLRVPLDGGADRQRVST